MSVEEAKSTEDDVLVMLSKGVAYACSQVGGREGGQRRVCVWLGGEIPTPTPALRARSRSSRGCTSRRCSTSQVGKADTSHLTAKPPSHLAPTPCDAPPPPPPEAVVKQPPIHVLVVDYSSVYGTDCAGEGHRLGGEGLR